MRPAKAQLAPNAVAGFIALGMGVSQDYSQGEGPPTMRPERLTRAVRKLAPGYVVKGRSPPPSRPTSSEEAGKCNAAGTGASRVVTGNTG
jgi:hypothetical protein